MKGITSQEAKILISKYGYNEFSSKSDWSIFSIALNQLNSFFVYILLAAALLSYNLGEELDAFVILFILVINFIVGFLQEYKADKALDSLKKMLNPTCNVYRDGKLKNIETRFIVPSDLVSLQEGDRVPADGIIISAFSAKVDESMLTGESLAVKKSITESENYVYKGTLLVQGRLDFVVEKTGKDTKFGKILDLVSTNPKEVSLLTLKLNKLAKKLSFIIFSLFIFLFALGYYFGVPFKEMLFTSVALAVSAIPEGLPMIVTLTLAFGVQVMARKKAIVRKLNSVETLGATTMICTDKTGTLTQNEMSVSSIYTLDYELKLNHHSKSIDLNLPEQIKMVEICNVCNNATIESNIGDPMEIALKVFANRFDLNHNYEVHDEIAFTSERKMMTVFSNETKENYAKGAFSVLIKKSKYILINGKSHKLTKFHTDILRKKVTEYENSAFRVLALAYNANTKINEDNLIFCGLVALQDPPRPEVEEALKQIYNAGIDVKILTGDSLNTALSIASQVGVKNLEGVELTADYPISKLKKIIDKNTVFARISPEHKYEIVQYLKSKGHIVASFGDGVNDAPALKIANVGVAMGIKGTEATKEVADLVLQDDNFATISDAIYEGRRIYTNILSFIKYMLSANFSSISTVFITTFLGLPLPILPLQILWINVATDALPALALGSLQGSKELMNKKPFKQNWPIFSHIKSFVFSAAIIQGLANLFVFYYGYSFDLNAGINFSDFSIASKARTMVFTQIVLFELFLVYTCMPSYLKKFSNKIVNLSILFSFLLQVILFVSPSLRSIFKLYILNPQDLLILFGVSASAAFLVPQLENLLFKRK